MFAYRWTFIVKHENVGELRELFEASAFRVDYAKTRLYAPDLSPDLFVTELVVESEEAQHKFFAEFNATPEAAPFWEKFNALTERRVSIERWTVTEIG